MVSGRCSFVVDTLRNRLDWRAALLVNEIRKREQKNQRIGAQCVDIGLQRCWDRVIASAADQQFDQRRRRGLRAGLSLALRAERRFVARCSPHSGRRSIATAWNGSARTIMSSP